MGVRHFRLPSLPFVHFSAAERCLKVFILDDAEGIVWFSRQGKEVTVGVGRRGVPCGSMNGGAIFSMPEPVWEFLLSRKVGEIVDCVRYQYHDKDLHASVHQYHGHLAGLVILSTTFEKDLPLEFGAAVEITSCRAYDEDQLALHGIPAEEAAKSPSEAAVRMTPGEAPPCLNCSSIMVLEQLGWKCLNCGGTTEAASGLGLSDPAP